MTIPASSVLVMKVWVSRLSNGSINNNGNKTSNKTSNGVIIAANPP